MHSRFPWLTLWIIPVFLSCSACSDDDVTVGAAPADATAAQGDTAIAKDTASGPAPTIVGEPHKADPYVEMAGEWDANTRHVVVTVWIGGIKNLLGIAAHLRYDPEALQLVKGEVLAVAQGKGIPGSNKTRAVYNDALPGRVLLGSARFATNPLPWTAPTGAAVSREAWVKLEFAPLKAGATTLGFDPHTTLLRSDDGTEIQAEWHGASVDVPAAVLTATAGVP